MAKGRAIAIAGALASVLTLLFCASAGAAPRRHASPAPRVVRTFEVAGSNGYTIAAGVSESDDSDGPFLVLLAFDSDSLSAYIVKAQPAGKYGIRADFGPFGSVAAHFVPEGRRWVKGGCGEKPELIAVGHIVGRFEFHGEGLYTEFPAQRVDVEPPVAVPWECVSVGSMLGHHPGALLDIRAKDIEVGVAQNRLDGPVRITAATTRELGGVLVQKLTEAIAPASAFTWSKNLRRATLAPPPPFSGSATYESTGRGDDSFDGRWRGDLTVDFPGAPGSHLTGEFESGELTHGQCRVKGEQPEFPPFGWCLF